MSHINRCVIFYLEYSAMNFWEWMVMWMKCFRKLNFFSPRKNLDNQSSWKRVKKIETLITNNVYVHCYRRHLVEEQMTTIYNVQTKCFLSQTRENLKVEKFCAKKKNEIIYYMLQFPSKIKLYDEFLRQNREATLTYYGETDL